MEEEFPIENGFKTLAKEVPVPGAVIDVVGIDNQKRYCIVELKVNKHQSTWAKRQLLAGGIGLNKVLGIFNIKPRTFRYIHIHAHRALGHSDFKFSNESWENETSLLEAMRGTTIQEWEK